MSTTNRPSAWSLNLSMQVCANNRQVTDDLCSFKYRSQRLLPGDHVITLGVQRDVVHFVMLSSLCKFV